MHHYLKRIDIKKDAYNYLHATNCLWRYPLNLLHHLRYTFTIISKKKKRCKYPYRKLLSMFPPIAPAIHIISTAARKRITENYSHLETLTLDSKTFFSKSRLSTFTSLAISLQRSAEKQMHMCFLQPGSSRPLDGAVFPLLFAMRYPSLRHQIPY